MCARRGRRDGVRLTRSLETAGLRLTSEFIRTGRASVQVPLSLRRELEERLTQAGLPSALGNLHQRDDGARASRNAVLLVLDAWRGEVHDLEFGLDLEELRQALHEEAAADDSARATPFAPRS